jgi:hypothetical protein
MTLTEEHAALVKGMLNRGDKQHDIAAFFGVNGGRIAEIKTGKRFPDVAPAPKRELPLVSALASGIAIHQARKALDRAQSGIDAARAFLDEFEQRMDAT